MRWSSNSMSPVRTNFASIHPFTFHMLSSVLFSPLSDLVLTRQPNFVNEYRRTTSITRSNKASGRPNLTTSPSSIRRSEPPRMSSSSLVPTRRKAVPFMSLCFKLERLLALKTDTMLSPLCLAPSAVANSMVTLGRSTLSSSACQSTLSTKRCLSHGLSSSSFSCFLQSPNPGWHPRLVERATVESRGRQPLEPTRGNLVAPRSHLQDRSSLRLTPHSLQCSISGLPL